MMALSYMVRVDTQTYPLATIIFRNCERSAMAIFYWSGKVCMRSFDNMKRMKIKTDISLTIKGKKWLMCHSG